MWKNIAEPYGPQMIIWRMNSACWIPNATGAHSEYLILIVCPCNNDCKNAPHFYVKLKSPVL